MHKTKGMDLSGIISISGRPGLYKVIAQGKNNIIVEGVKDKKRFPAYSSDKISALEDISIYTLSEDKPLKEIFVDILAKIGNTEAPTHKEDISTLQDFLGDILPNYDEERVYPSDIKKLFQWYNILFKAGVIKEEVKEKPKTVKKTPVKKEATAKKETTTKKPAAKKKAPAKPKTTATKKAPAKKKAATK